VVKNAFLPRIFNGKKRFSCTLLKKTRFPSLSDKKEKLIQNNSSSVMTLTYQRENNIPQIIM